MTRPALRPGQDRDALIAAARADGVDTDPGADLDGSTLRVGWENVVLDTPDGWIVRFPRDEDVALDREVALLARLAGRLPVPIPRVVRTGRTSRFMVYRRLDGAPLDPTAFEVAPPLVRDRVAADLARFLAAMHSAVTADEIAELGVPPVADDAFRSLDPRALPKQLQDRYAAVRADFDRRLRSGRHRVLLHNDFHAGNLVLDAPLGRLAGVWDFSCVSTGDPSLDFRYLCSHPELATRTASAYAARTGLEIDLGLASSALTLEGVSDALEEGRDPAPHLR